MFHEPWQNTSLRVVLEEVPEETMRATTVKSFEAGQRNGKYLTECVFRIN
jgi:hypothetical protein